jgi:hypothetical protein
MRVVVQAVSLTTKAGIYARGQTVELETREAHRLLRLGVVRHEGQTSSRTIPPAARAFEKRG